MDKDSFGYWLVTFVMGMVVIGLLSIPMERLLRKRLSGPLLVAASVLGAHAICLAIIFIRVEDQSQLARLSTRLLLAATVVTVFRSSASRRA